MGVRGPVSWDTLEQRESVEEERDMEASSGAGGSAGPGAVSWLVLEAVLRRPARGVEAGVTAPRPASSADTGEKGKLEVGLVIFRDLVVSGE